MNQTWEFLSTPAYRQLSISLFDTLGESLVNGGRRNPSCAEHQSIDFSGAQAFFCRMKGRYVVVTIDTETPRRAEATEVLINPSHQSMFC